MKLFFVSDLTLAAELGKTLLERNKELETEVLEWQHCYAEQKQEITVHLAPIPTHPSPIPKRTKLQTSINTPYTTMTSLFSAADQTGGGTTSRERLAHAHLRRNRQKRSGDRESELWCKTESA